MSHQYPNGAMCCATCQYWRGDRKMLNSNFIEVKDTRITGTCSKPGNIRNGKQMQACENCSQWKKG